MAAMLGLITTAGAGSAVADNLVPDGDLLVSGAQGTLALGEICTGETAVTTSPNVRLAISRNGNYSNGNVFRAGSTVTISDGSFIINQGQASIGGLPFTVNDGTIGIPTTWAGTSNNVLTSDTGSATVGFTASATPGPVLVDQLFKATGVDANGAALVRTEKVTVSATVVDCAPTDTTPPASSAAATSGGGSYAFGDWTNQDVTLALTATDDAEGSGVKEIRYTVDGTAPTATHGSVYDAAAKPVISAEGTTTVKYAAVDNAGNLESPVNQALVRIDKTKPIVDDDSMNTPLSGTLGNGGWYTSPVSVTFRASDGLSGFLGKSDPHSVTNASGTGAEGAAVTVPSPPGIRDLATNEADHVEAGPFKIDLSDPVVTCGAIPTLTLGSAGNVTATVTDAVSGPTSPTVSAPADTSSVGSRSVTVTGYDEAGRSASASCDYTVIYDWSGFFAPVDNLPTWNSIKAGSAVPVKFSLAGDQGLDIMAAGYPRSSPVTCGSSATVDAVEQTVTAGGSSLSYDATTERYNYVWKTEKAWAGSCRQLVVQLNDGTFHRANFKLLK